MNREWRCKEGSSRPLRFLSYLLYKLTLMPKKKKVFVGLSGGVDSSVAAALLKKEGYDVTGVFIKAWHPDFLTCDWRGERQYAMRVCAVLDIPFETFDFEKEYKKEVVDYMISEYKAGRTPNPDVMCNRRIKFGLFLEEAVRRGADYIATGHYARIKHDTNTRMDTNDANKNSPKYKLLTGADKEKDQSYFLWTLGQRELSRSLFPVGHLQKSEVRDIARDFGLPTAEKKDSQGLCFLGQVDMAEFLGRYLPKKKGQVKDTSGEIIGEHEGAHFYTVGQRHGFKIRQKSAGERPYYVVVKNEAKNEINVSDRLEDKKKELSSRVVLGDTNWISSPPEGRKEYRGRIRYRQLLRKAVIKVKENGKAVVDFKEPQRVVSAGQSAVFYDGEEVLGGGVVNGG